MLKFVYLGCKMWAQKLYRKSREVTINAKKKKRTKINKCCGKNIDQPKAFSLISSWDHCQRFSPSDASQAGFEPRFESNFAE